MTDERPAKWARVTRAAPCPICGRTHYCTRSCDGVAVRCTKIESARPSTSRDGSTAWLHTLSDPLPAIAPPKEEKIPDAEIHRRAMAMFSHSKAAAKREQVAAALGVSVHSLSMLLCGIGWDWRGREFASFPSRDSEGRIIGITRRYEDGAKMTLKGTSNAGVFCSPYWWRGEVTYIVEGASDVAALLDVGVSVIGRPSNTGGIRALVGMLRRHVPARLVVVGENDRKPERPGTVQQCPVDCGGCSWCWPGIFGAKETQRALSRQLRRHVGLLMPPVDVKDVRQWLHSGHVFP